MHAQRGIIGWFLFFLLLPVLAWAQYRRGSPFIQEATILDNQWFQHGIALTLGLVIGALFSDKYRTLRKFLFLGLGLLCLVLGVLASSYLGNVVFFTIGAVVAWRALRDIKKRIEAAYKKPTTFGSAEWADSAHLQAHGLTGSTGLRLGVFQTADRTLPVHYTGNRHLLTVAPTRSGKGVTAIIPNLLTYEGSVLVIDPKGENALMTVAQRGMGNPGRAILGLGQTVHVVDPWGITGLPAARFNPLDWLQPEDADISENAMILADAIVVPRTGTSEPFWDEEAKALLMGLLLYVALDDAEQPHRHLGRVRDIITAGEADFQGILLRMGEHQNPIVVTTAERTAGKDPKLRSNVITSLQSHTHFLDSPRIRDSLQVSDFRFEDLKTSAMTVYLVLPADRLGTFGRWLRLLIQQAITVNARNLTIKPEKPILFLLDEMAALQKLTMVEQAYGLMAGFGMQLWGIIQDLSQLERLYDKGWETFISNAGVLQYFGSRDHKTAEYFSKLCGVTTIEKFSFSTAIAKTLGWSRSSSGESGTSGSESDTLTYNFDIVQRPLAFPDELMVMRDEKQVVLIEHFNPIPGRKVRWYTDPQLQTLGVNLGP